MGYVNLIYPWGELISLLKNLRISDKIPNTIESPKESRFDIIDDLMTMAREYEAN